MHHSLNPGFPNYDGRKQLLGTQVSIVDGKAVAVVGSADEGSFRVMFGRRRDSDEVSNWALRLQIRLWRWCHSVLRHVSSGTSMRDERSVSTIHGLS
jgi:hypothetical protein